VVELHRLEWLIFPEPELLALDASSRNGSCSKAQVDIARRVSNAKKQAAYSIGQEMVVT
jgi:hypothetical protein